MGILKKSLFTVQQQAHFKYRPLLNNKLHLVKMAFPSVVKENPSVILDEVEDDEFNINSFFFFVNIIVTKGQQFVKNLKII